MNLAAILSISLLSVTAATAPPVPEFSGPRTTQAAPTPQTQPSDTSASQNTEPTQPADSTKPAKPAPHSAVHSRKKVPCSNSATPLKTASDPAPAAAPSSHPCPPPKKVVHNGGSDEPSIQLVGGTAADQALQQRSTAQLTAATEDNLKQLAGRPLSANQQDMVNQIKQFMDQSTAAVAAGDSARGHNLAQKAHLLSEELVKPSK
jgi:hypothetical protein